MQDAPVYVAFVWHMHQPFYKDFLSGETTMPWVRLHAIKDYLDMVELLQDFPALHQTFNLTPSLIEQLEDIAQPGWKKDKFFELTLKRPQDMDEDEKAFLLKNFFMANWDMMIRPFNRYYDLLMKRGKYLMPDGIPTVLKRFTDQDYLDLQVLFNLVWFDPLYRERDAKLKELARKGKYYSEADKALILDKQLEIVREVIPAYKKMQDDGIIEVSVSPFYHPILPLLCDTDIAKVSLPEIKLPKVTFRHPEDARFQLKAAVEYYAARFGRPPRGMWPSEGSISEEVVDLAIESDLNWMATDEQILFNSIGRYGDRESLYRPYVIQRKYGELALIFRDRALSDSIGFTYQAWPAEKAVADLKSHLYNIGKAASKTAPAVFVPIILDGENTWEYYPNDGRDFLLRLYAALADDPRLKFVTVSEFLQGHQPTTRLERLYPGSWINANFAIWIGHEEKNRAWEYLKEARDCLRNYEREFPDRASDERLKMAWKEIYIAEGSDWNWWFGDDHSSANDEEFDRLFRAHLLNIYGLLGREPPEHLSVPIKAKRAKVLREPSALMRPIIDGMDTNYFEWLSAGLIDTSKYGGTMHQVETIVRRIYFGFDMDSLYLRFDLSLSGEASERQGLNLNLFVIERGIKITLPLAQTQERLEYTIYGEKKEGGWYEFKKQGCASLNKILELAVKFKEIGAQQGEAIKVLAAVEREGLVIERCPEYGPIQIALPAADYESQCWTA